MGCSKPFCGCWAPIDPTTGNWCNSARYLRRETVDRFDATIRDGISPDPIGAISWTQTTIETWNRFTGWFTRTYATTLPPDTTLPVFDVITEQTIVDNTEVLYSLYTESHDSTTDSDLKSTRTISISGKYTWDDFLDDFAALYKVLSFQAMHALTQANPYWRHRVAGYNDAGVVCYEDYYAPAPGESFGHSVYSGTDTSAWYFGTTGRVDWGAVIFCSAGYVTKADLASFYGGCAAISIKPLAPNQQLCHSMTPYSGCPSTAGTTTYTAFPTGNLSAVQLGGGGGGGSGNFIERLFTHNCTAVQAGNTDEGTYGFA